MFVLYACFHANLAILQYGQKCYFDYIIKIGRYLQFQVHDLSFCVIFTQRFLTLKTESVIAVEEFVLV